MNNRFFIPSLALILAVAGIYFTWGGKTNRIIIGVIGPLTGPAAAYGKSHESGIQLAVSHINSAGNTAGKVIEVISADDQNDKVIAAEAARDLIYKKGAALIIGAISSDNTMNIQRICEIAKVPVITAVSTNPFITRVNFPYSFRCLSDDNVQANELARYTVEKLGIRRIAIIHDTNKYGSEGARTYRRNAEKLGQKIVAMEEFSAGDINFRTQISRIKKASPEGIVIWGLFKESAMVLKHCREAGINVPAFGGDGMALPAFLTLAGISAENTVLTYPFDPERGGLDAARFIESYQKRYNILPDSFAAHGYDAMKLVGMAIMTSDGTSDSIRDSLSRIRSYSGVAGKGGLDETGNETRRVQLAFVKNGAFVPMPLTGENK
ncbi:MAG: ABC transporter substrate-binding protein [Candidatus Riflebacteria bacterium]|nr:ABC transporter substrate-binding protein [Candidatus Riflebacteria bacterium]